MGRRKIEIQPITHERNRSVTFLKRKNGLFKKAYELGVLCSVDVAVIIFEERPGHHLKLYQYCSTDIHDIVQRHLRHEGEKDTRGPGDFSGNAAGKLDDGDGDDDEDDEDDVGASRKRGRGSDAGKLKPTHGDIGIPDDLSYLPSRNSMSLPQPPLNLNLPSTASSTTLPISSDRVSSLRSSHHIPPHQVKKPRIGTLHPTHPSRSPSDEQYYSSQFSRGFGGAGGGGGGGGGYNSYYSGPGNSGGPMGGGHGHGGHSNTPPAPSFMPLSSSEFSSPPASHTRLTSDTRNGYPAPPGRSGSGFGGVYAGGMVRSGSRAGGGGPGSGAGGNDDIFAAFLGGAGEGRPPQPPPGGPGGEFGIDWPVHGGTGGPPPVPSTPQSAQPPPDSSHWLDFLSGNPNNSSSSSAQQREAMSWERGGPDADIFAPGERPGSERSSTGGPGKRSRVGSDAGSSNPGGAEVNGRGEDKDMKGET